MPNITILFKYKTYGLVLAATLRMKKDIVSKYSTKKST